MFRRIVRLGLLGLLFGLTGAFVGGVMFVLASLVLQRDFI